MLAGPERSLNEAEEGQEEDVLKHKGPREGAFVLVPLLVPVPGIRYSRTA